MFFKIVASLLTISLIIIIHELGHFAAAKLLKIRIYEFSIGLGPKILGIINKGINYSLRIIPFGGYVKLAGIDNLTDDNDCKNEEKLNKRPYWQQILVLFAGSGSNLFFSLLLFILIYSFIGLPGGISPVIKKVFPETPAFEQNLQSGDVIIAVGDLSVNSGQQVIKEIQKTNGNTVKITILRDKEQKTFTIQPYKKDGKYFLGIKLTPELIKKENILTAIAISLLELIKLITIIVLFLIKFFTFQTDLSNIIGPLGMVSLSGEIMNYGLANFIFFVAFININIAVLNLFPFPALDGGRIFILTLEKSLRKKFDESHIKITHSIGFFILISILIYITYFDLKDLLVK